jgi:hypothetical protein
MIPGIILLPLNIPNSSPHSFCHIITGGIKPALASALHSATTSGLLPQCVTSEDMKDFNARIACRIHKNIYRCTKNSKTHLYCLKAIFKTYLFIFIIMLIMLQPPSDLQTKSQVRSPAQAEKFTILGNVQPSDRTPTCPWNNCLFQRIATFMQYTPQKHKVFDMKLYNLCKSLQFTYDVRAYIARKCKNATVDVTPTTHGRILQLGWSVQMLVTNGAWVITKFTSSGLFLSLYRKKCLL